MALILENLEATRRLGRLIATGVSQERPPAIFLTGDLGCGKTTLAGAILANLPNSGQCEFASPSFTIYNIYPTTPPMLHCDLYRCRQSIPDEIYEALDDGSMLVLVEWAQYIPAREIPPEYLDINFSMDNYVCLLDVKAAGEDCARLLEKMRSSLPSS